MSILPPELDANYELLAEMHEGGMGAVYKARHRHLDKRCVIKVMHPKLNENAKARERFFREAKRGNELHHTNIAAVQTFFVASDGKAYLVVDYVDGKNLRELLNREGFLPWQRVIDIGVQALAALGYLHSQQIIHRDISPENLMLTKDESGLPLVKLIDLGIAKSLDEATSFTEAGAFVGKVYYASPEQFRQQADARSDLYSLGVVLYELATGARPGRETNTMDILAAAAREEPALPFSETDPNGHVPLALRTVILKAIERRPENRFQTAGEFSEALENALAAGRTTMVDVTPVTEPPDEPVIAPAPPRPPAPVSPFPRVVVGTALVLLLGAIGARRMLPAADDTTPERPRVESAAVPTGTSVTVTSPAPVMPQRVAPAPVTPEGRQSAAESIARGKGLAAERKFQEAYASFAEATRADPDNAFAWANYGGAAALLEKPAEARDAYERALQIDPDNWLAHYNLACLLTGSGARNEAFEHLDAAVTQLRRQTQSRDELEAVMSSMRADEALEALRNDPRFSKLLAMD